MQRILNEKTIRKLPIFVGLLLCLCFSNGEGLHLLPFSDSTKNLGFSNVEFKTASTKYQFSTHSQNSFDGKFQSKNLKNSGKDSFALTISTFNKIFTKKTDTSNKNFETKPKILLSEFLLTSVSDRAPPC